MSHQAPPLNIEAQQAVTSATPSASSGLTARGSQGGLPDHIDAPGNISPANARINLVNKSPAEDNKGHGALVVLRPGEAEELDISWKAFALASDKIVIELLDIFMQIVYPL